MRLTLDGLLIIDAISRRGSFAAAAEELSRVPSTITYAVQKLEEDLGVAIFDRSGHRARLTPAGEELLREGRLIIQAVANLEDRAKGLSQGYEATLRIALDALLPCEPLLDLAAEFYKTHDSTDTRAPPDERGGNRQTEPTVTAPHLDSTESRIRSADPNRYVGAPGAAEAGMDSRLRRNDRA